ncbi:MAG: hypothetical protein FJZ01_00260 [Candidatus Sericytochromatia bacterium]|nr:hypothetical protein [Candidatus Tanganyikabacteria bacterium]
MIPPPCGEVPLLAALPPALIADARPGAPIVIPLAADPATPSAAGGPTGDALEILADRVEVDLDDEVLQARGGVQVAYLDYRLRAAELLYDAINDRGRAGGKIHLRTTAYQIDSEHIEFDIRNEQAMVGPWSGVAAGRGRLSGAFLFVSPSYAYASGATYSPCMADDPGYFLASEKFEWFPYNGRQHFEGDNVTVHLSGAPVAKVPLLRTAVEPGEELERERRRPGQAVDTQLGYNTYDGAFATGKGTFQLADGHLGTIPVRITQGRGLLIGTTQNFAWERWSFSGDATYQTRYQGGTAGPRANVTGLTTIPRGPALSVGLGYRSDVAGQAVHRFPEVGVTFPGVSLGPLALTAGTRLGYMMENYPDPTAPPPDPINPFAQQPEKIGVRAAAAGYRLGVAAPAWRPNGFWESQLYTAGSVAMYLERDEPGEWSRSPRHQAVGTLGLRNTQRWTDFLSTQVGLESHRTEGLSPFLHDRAYPSDMISLGFTLQPHARWALSAGTLFSRPPDQPSFARNDLTVRLGYSGPCLSWAISMQILSFQPFSPAISFDYQIGSL